MKGLFITINISLISKAMKNLGKKAKDKITGFTGIITSKINYITGCDQYGLTPAVSKEGKIGDSQWFDENRIKIIGKGVSIASVRGKINGGPNRDCPK